MQEARQKLTRGRRRSTLHQDTVEALRAKVRAEGRVGERLPSIAALAKELSTSSCTVRSALLTLASEGLVTLRHGSGCYVNLSATPRPPCVGLFTDLHLLRAGALRFHGLVFDQARELLTAAGLMTRVYPGSSRDCLNPHQAKYPEFVADVQEGRLRGVIVLAFSMAGEWLEALRARQLPMVHLDYAPHPGCVSLDYAALVRRAVEHLRRRGCRRLALVGYGGGRLGGTAVQDQCAAVFREAVAAAGLPVYDEWIRTDLLPTDTGSGWEEFREVWTAHAEKPDGVLVSDDVLAPDVARAIRELGIRVPDQLTVVTHANRGVPLALPFAAPRLEFDPAAVAAALVRLMVGRLRGELKDDSQITLAPELVDEPETTEAPGLVGARSTP